MSNLTNVYSRTGNRSRDIAYESQGVYHWANETKTKVSITSPGPHDQELSEDSDLEFEPEARQLTGD
jgi:hypothetical protein